MKYLIALMLLVTAPAFAQEADPTGPALPSSNIGNYRGSYVLTHDRLGICPPNVRVWSSEGLDGDTFQIWVGDWFFRNVNAGPQSFNNEFEKGSSVSTYRGNTLTFTRRWYHKIKRVNERQQVQARFRGNNLRIVSRLWGSPPTERDCAYKRLPDTSDSFDDNIDNSEGTEFRLRRRGR
jgi:hypothetical protein